MPLQMTMFFLPDDNYEFYGAQNGVKMLQVAREFDEYLKRLDKGDLLEKDTGSCYDLYDMVQDIREKFNQMMVEAGVDIYYDGV